MGRIMTWRFKGRPGKGLAFLWVTFLWWAVWAPGLASPEDQYAGLRKAMVRAIQADVKETRAWIGKGELASGVLEAMGAVPRHAFVPARLRSSAYENRPLPIGYGQTISQPFIVALMTDLLGTGPESKVLEVGTGSGYQAAVLAKLVKRVCTIEIIPQLSRRAEDLLASLGYRNVKCRTGDGYYGWPEEAPFDEILVTAAADHIPPPLIRQLKPGGRMILPVGDPFAVQQLILVQKGSDGKVRSRQILPVRFVPLTGGLRP
jgi:protein-L-isoaspartate(D-aspartate) O-methyltransferase